MSVHVELQVAAALREGKAVEPESYDCVTIFFSDIVGFTNISGLLQPQEVGSCMCMAVQHHASCSSVYSLSCTDTLGLQGSVERRPGVLEHSMHCDTWTCNSAAGHSWQYVL